MFTSDATELAPHMTIPLDPWIVAAHVSETTSPAEELDELVTQLTVALEEIARAARASGCWNSR
jgi:predicted transcriptional regulator